MPSAISLKKLTASSWSAENEAESEGAPVEADTAQTDKPKHSKKTKRKGESSVASRVDTETILDAKRKRTIPLAELQLTEWFKENFESAEDGYLTGRKMYEFYKQNCVLHEINVPELTFFNRQLNNILGGKRYLIKEGSAYKGMVSEKKAEKKKPVKKAESLMMKLKDMIIEGLTEGGSPKKGLRFQWLEKFIIAKYPALRLDLKPHLLLNTLERAVKYGYVQLVRGIGRLGYYRLPGEYPDDEEDEKKKKKKAKKPAADAEKGENGVKEGEEPKEGEETKGDEKAVNGKDEDTTEGEKKKGTEKTKKKKSKRRPRPRSDYERISRHVEPKTIDDTFPMAMTFMCEPKDASSLKIKKYIQKYFPHVDLETHFKKTLLNGCEKGLWEQVTGTGTTGSFRLQVDDINPLDCTTLEDMICLAILACHEPKQTSVNLLKQYIIEYHPNFNIDKRPYYFKKALEKAEGKGHIIRLSGIGCSGSFQLAEAFTPSPNWLGGEQESDVEEEVTEILQVEEQAYKARPSKRRGMGRAAAAKGRPPDFVSYSTAKPSKPKKRKRKVEYREVEESEEEEEAPPKRSKSRSKKAPSKSRSRRAAAESDEDLSEGEEPAEYTPKKTASRGGAKQKAKAKTASRSNKKKPKAEKKGKKGSKSGGKAPKAKQVVESEEEAAEEEEEEDVQETKEVSKKRKSEESKSSKSASKSSSKRKSSSGKQRGSSKRRDDLSDDDDDVAEARAKSPRKKAKVDYGETRYDSDDEEEEVRPSKSKGSSSRRKADSDSEEETRSPARSRGKPRYEEEDEGLSEGEELPSKSKSRKSSGSRSSRGKPKNEEDDDESLSEGEESPAKSKSKRSPSKTAKVEPMYTDSEEEGEVKSRSKSFLEDLGEDSEDDSWHKPKSPKKSPKKGSKKRR